MQTIRQNGEPKSANAANGVPAVNMDGVEIRGELTREFSEILSPEAIRFVADLQRRFGATRLKLLGRRAEYQQRLDRDPSFLPDFLKETQEIRQGSWTVAKVASDLQDRRVEITGPVERKMVINALNSGAQVFMADFEDSHTPTWKGTIEGQINMRDAVRRTISFTSPEGKQYALNEKTAVLMVRPRGWHLEEKHVLVDGEPMSGSLFDFGLYFFHNAKELLKRGSGPYFYLPKMESHLEARLWNDVFVHAQKQLGIPNGTIKATVLIETILASFEMNEILFELKDHSAGLNCGRWDYIFSFIKKFRLRPEFVMPDRALVTMNVHFLKSYSHLLIQTCHKRGAHAMGGMAAQIPIKNDENANLAAMEKVRADKLREVTAGHDGTWVAHPGLVPIARQIFDEHMKTPNQLQNRREDVQVSAADLIAVPEGLISEAGLRTNINVALLYLESWLRGIGCVPLYNLMEDAATAEISRAQVWQWIRHPKGVLADGRKVTRELFRQVLDEELSKIKSGVGDSKYASGKYAKASELLDQIITSEEFVEFLTLPAYRAIS
jgi:malate synthase